MKKIAAVLLSMCFVLSLAACGGSDSSATPASDAAPEVAGTDGETNDAAENTEGGGANADAIVLRIGHGNNDKTPYHQGLERFVEVLEELTDGAVTGEIYASATLGNEREMAEGMALGTTDISVASTAVLQAFVPQFGILNAPFLIKDADHALRVVEGEVGDYLSEELKGISWNNIGWMSSGFRNTFSTKPIESLADYSGVKIRVMENEMYISLFENLGAIAVPMAASEQFTALQQGTIDANENGISNLLTESWYEVCKYATLSEHVYGMICVGISDAALAKVPEEYHEALYEAGKAMQEYQLQLIAEENDSAQKELEELGITFYEIDKDELRAAVEPLYTQFADSIPADLVEKVNAVA